ncbi:hypothetical protein [Rhodomicrobium lacus]|uniref:hypothetical protein n=1 Tax=Rhodomicrobium TaxID=1068 RepID=UPI0026E311E2|nr:hypothetical protein [Rhodomicrobium lacus]WKW50398.1 hypothetical protein QMO75_14090 [Rhodomicrobium lacus]
MDSNDNGEGEKSPEIGTTKPHELTRRGEALAENLAWGTRATKHFQRMTNYAEYRKAFQKKYPI